MNWITDKFKRIKPKIKNLFRVKIGPRKVVGKLFLWCRSLQARPKGKFICL